jgi:hypothetical protein
VSPRPGGLRRRRSEGRRISVGDPGIRRASISRRVFLTKGRQDDCHCRDTAICRAHRPVPESFEHGVPGQPFRGCRTFAAVRSRRITGTMMLTFRACASPICPECSAGYRCIELTTPPGKHGEFRCLICDHPLELFEGSSEVALRPTVQPRNLSMIVRTAFKLTSGVR